MTLEERDRKLQCLEDILEQPRNDQNVVAVALFKIWHDVLWEVSDDSFDEFVQNEYEMSEADAFIIMKAAASAGMFADYETEKINEQFERLG
jgi:predicted oxidoreductase (fatty acid repression mutant protein)